MKELNFARKSWHFHIAKTYGGLDLWSDDSTNICTYTRKVIIGVIVATLLVPFLTALVFYPIVNFAIFLLVWAQFGVMPGLDLGALAFLVEVGTITVFFITAILAGLVGLWFETSKKD